MKVSWACQSLLRNFFSRTHQKSSVNGQKLCLLLEMDFNTKDLKTALLLSIECWQRRSFHPALLLSSCLQWPPGLQLSPWWIPSGYIRNVLSFLALGVDMLLPLSQLAVTLSLSLSHLNLGSIFPYVARITSFSPAAFFHFAVHCSQQDRTTFPCSALPQLFDHCLWCEHFCHQSLFPHYRGTLPANVFGQSSLYFNEATASLCQGHSSSGLC